MKLSRTAWWILGLLTALVLTGAGSVYVAFRSYDRESEAIARSMVRDLRSAGPLYAVQEPQDPDELVQQVQVERAGGRAVTGIVSRSFEESSVVSTWPGGKPETCTPGKGHDRDYSGDTEPAGDAVMYTSCVRLTDDAVLTLRSSRPPSRAGGYPVFYVDLLVTFGTTTASVSIAPDDVTLTRARVVADARRLLPKLHPLDLTRFSDAELLAAARREVNLDRSFWL